MDFYSVNLAALVALNAALAYHQRKQTPEIIANPEDGPENKVVDNSRAIATFKNRFFLVYMLVVGSDWLQGPYIYTLYKETLSLPEQVVAALFSTGFIAGAVSATFAGGLADKHGRKAACLAFCVIYSASCLSILSSNLVILFIGRALGGISTTLLYSAFEAWMVAEFHRRELDKAGAQLSSIFGTMTTLSSIVAIAAGVVSEWLVSLTGTRKAPFMASIACLAVAFPVISRYWVENHGEGALEKTSTKSMFSNVRPIIQDKRILTLGAISCFFEGTMYLFIYFWSPTLISARESAGTQGSPPFGMIFASFMSSMMLGSMLFAVMTPSSRDSISLPSYFLRLLLAVASSCLLLTVILHREAATFWAFCLFELCVGVYFPSMGLLKGQIVADADRGTVYGLLRFPLNIFVVMSLGLTREGDAHRDNVFIACGALLLLGMIVVNRFFPD